MAWTESRSRDEWLAEVKRRGERLRRRRQITVALIGALALVLPASAVAGFLTADRGADQQLAVAGPTPGPARVPDTGAALEAATPLLAPDEPATTTTTIVTVVRQPAGVSASGAVTSPTSVPSNDNPVVARATTTTVVAADGTTRASSQGAAQSAAVAPPPAEPLAPCAHTEVIMTLKLDKDAYRSGEVIRGSSAVEPRPGIRCRLFGFSEFQILNSAGKDVMPAGPALETGHSLSTGDDGGPAYGKSYFSWEAIDCTPQRLSPIIPAPGDRTGCVPFPPGRYTVVALWEDGWMPDPVTFQLTA